MCLITIIRFPFTYLFFICVNFPYSVLSLISLHDAAEFMRNSQMNKDSIVTSNLTVFDNALFDITPTEKKNDTRLFIFYIS